ncbi:helix-turn-helix domain-containing protein [Achromobacter xylosoxidans]|uniref:helix-turn-helix domain-containing protein n=1 Tax=Alcaligenes xylosoxydans xylosoxydans TaxID=85698 RepID=UPI001F137504|nr:helix-turn-helix domain-containing protein [Achromobacter xylosoxidans]
MSVEASKWARMADVQKSSSKLVLINLAQLVRYDSDDWTVFASIEYLACVTHLNRKTVIDALGRLRKLGAIQDTGRRAGDNRSSIIYRLCPNAVPLLKLSTARAADGLAEEAPQPGQDNFLSELDAPPFPLNTTGVDAPANDEEFDQARSEQKPFDALTPALDTPDGHTGPYQAPEDREQRIEAARTQASDPKSRIRRRPNAGPAATRLSATWKLPAKWRAWAQGQKPQWSDEKIDAMAATFSAYKRSQPGDSGTSSDWFESWRLWVFREWEPKGSANKPWQSTWSGIVAKGKKLGLEQAPNEPEPEFKARVFRAAGLVPSH